MASFAKPGWLMKALQVFSARNQLLQVAALPWRLRNGAVEVCLVTSRGSGRWILPKGWPEKHLSHAGAAAQEAWEEAGLRGKISPVSCGSFTATKGVEPDLQLSVNMEVYLLREPEQLQDYPEKGQRQVRWMPLAKAIEMASEPALADLLERLDKQGAFADTGD